MRNFNFNENLKEDFCSVALQKINYNSSELSLIDSFDPRTNRFTFELETSNLFNNEVAGSIDYEYYEGFVNHTNDETFTVVLYRVNDHDKIPKISAELQKSELTDKEQDELTIDSKVCVKLGKYFSNGEEKHTFDAHLLPQPPISQEDINEAYRKANEFLESIGKH